MYGAYQGGAAGGASALSGLSDVTISSPSNGQALVYNSVSGKWENNTVSATNSAKCFHGYKSSDTSVSSTTWTVIPFEAEYLDTQGGHSTSSNTDRYTVDTTGKWEFSWDVSWAGTSANTTGFLAAARNGTRERWAPAGFAASANQYYTASFSCIIDCTANDYIGLQEYMNGAGTVFAQGTGSIAVSNFKAKFLGT